MIHTIKGLRAIAAGALLTVCAAAAQAAPVFTVNPNSNGVVTATGQIFQADGINGSSSARITYTGTGYNYNGEGYINYSGFTLNGSPVDNADAQINTRTGYGLYATFNQTFSCSNFLQPGTSCGITSITLNLYQDAGNNNVYTQATAARDATVTANGTQILLGSVTRVTAGTAGIDVLGGAFQNVNTNFVITPEGQNFFTAPDPFYSFAFSAFNNTSQGLSCNGNTNTSNGGAANGCAGLFTSLAINQEGGFTDFNVPEPASLTIFGAGLLGLGALRRRKSK